LFRGLPLLGLYSRQLARPDFGAKCANQNQEARRSKEEIPSADKGEPGFYVVLGRLTLTSVAAVEWLNMAKD